MVMIIRITPPVLVLPLTPEAITKLAQTPGLCREALYAAIRAAIRAGLRPQGRP